MHESRRRNASVIWYYSFKETFIRFFPIIVPIRCKKWISMENPRKRKHWRPKVYDGFWCLVPTVERNQWSGKSLLKGILIFFVIPLIVKRDIHIMSALPFETNVPLRFELSFLRCPSRDQGWIVCNLSLIEERKIMIICLWRGTVFSIDTYWY